MKTGLTALNTPDTHLDALLRAHARSSTSMAVYLIGGGALLSSALVALACAGDFSPLLRWVPYAMLGVALLWSAVGGWRMTREHARLQACSAAYDAQLLQQAQARHAAPAADSGWTVITRLFETTPARRRRVRPVCQRPLSLFGAHARQHTSTFR